MAYTDLTIKQLYGGSFNECNHPDCDKTIIRLDTKTGKQVNFGQIAHIRGKTQTSERWEDGYPMDQLDSEPNLILLCFEHHIMIDQTGAEATYTTPIVEEWKAVHYAAKELIVDREWVYGASKLMFAVEETQVTLEYWHDEHGNVRFYTPERSKQMIAARDLSMLFSELSTMLFNLGRHDATPGRSFAYVNE